MNNFADYRNVSFFTNRATPSFMNVIKPRKTLTSRLLSKDSLSSVNGIINGAQKIVKIYDQAVPIISQVRPMFNNIRTTFKVAKAFKRFSGESSLEKAFDNLPDYEETIKDVKKEEVKQEKVEIEETLTSNPFYPKI